MSSCHPLSYALILFCLLLLSSCGRESTCSALRFGLGELSEQDAPIRLQMDLSKGPYVGIELPSAQQDGATAFILQAEVKNTSGRPQRMAYTLFYRNTSYAYPPEHPRSGDNFFGSWSDGPTIRYTEELAPGESITITDSLRIQGNPLGDSRYISQSFVNPWAPDEVIGKIERTIKNDSAWYAAIERKAEENNLDVETQLKKDARWMRRIKRVGEERDQGWQRNPRVGRYDFYIVAIPETELTDELRQVMELKTKGADGRYTDPLILTLKEETRQFITGAERPLLARMEVPLDKGVYVDYSLLESDSIDNSGLSDRCGPSDDLWENAPIEQFIHNIVRDYSLKNVPLSANVVQDPYTIEQFRTNAAKYPKAERAETHVQLTDRPCTSVQYDDEADCLVLRNPGRSSSGRFQKEQVGMSSRAGLTYGRYTAEIGFPKMINEDNVWNGLTCAFWLIYQIEGDHNNRRRTPGGYVLEVNEAMKGSPRVEDIHYSEIDIEIVKTDPRWVYSAADTARNKWIHREAAASNDIAVTFTNWDMADKSVERHVVHSTQLEVGGEEYEFHRWFEDYRAITCKTAQPHSEVFGRDRYFFQIDWRPQEIIWRMGPHPDSLYVFGQMDETMTNIPDNQMKAVVTQEFHYGKWWPSAPFKQDDIPYPENDLVGRVYSLTVD